MILFEFEALLNYPGWDVRRQFDGVFRSCSGESELEANFDYKSDFAIKVVGTNMGMDEMVQGNYVRGGRNRT